jgi:hypothetical protein
MLGGLRLSRNVRDGDEQPEISVGSRATRKLVEVRCYSPEVRFWEVCRISARIPKTAFPDM